MSATRSPISLDRIDRGRKIRCAVYVTITSRSSGTFVDEQQAQELHAGKRIRAEADDERKHRGSFQNLLLRRFHQGTTATYRILELDPAGYAFGFRCRVFASLGAAALSIEPLRWNDVVDPARSRASTRHGQDRDGWFRRWFDPEDEWVDPNADLSGVIHSLLIKPWRGRCRFRHGAGGRVLGDAGGS